MDFQLTCEQQRLQNKCRELAADFASRSAAHDRDASHPVENYARLRDEGFLALTVGKEWGGSGASFLDHTIAYEALGQGCPSTALAFNMHASVIMPLLESAEVAPETKQRLAELVVHERKLIAGNFSEPVTTSLIGERPLKTRARRADGGYRVTGRPEVELHPAAAEARGIAAGDWVSIETPEGNVRARARLNDTLDPRVAVGEHGWWQACPELGAPGYDPFGPLGANFNLLIGSTAVDPVSGTASHRSYLCEVRRVAPV